MRVFISHSNLDRWVARKISDDLGRLGIQTFLDEKHLATGESVDDAIGEHLADCDELLVILSPASLNSQWVFVEIGGAKALKKRLVPILFHVGANEMPPILARYLARDINDIEKYYSEVSERATRSAPHEETARVPAKPTSQKPPRLKPGDRVRIVAPSELSDEQKRLPPTWLPGMDHYGGMEANVARVEDSDVEGGQVCFLDGAAVGPAWASAWLRRLY